MSCSVAVASPGVIQKSMQLVRHPTPGPPLSAAARQGQHPLWVVGWEREGGGGVRDEGTEREREGRRREG